MTRKQKYPDTEVFHYFNKNTLGRITTDCVIRAVATFLDMSWEDCFREMTEFSIKTCVMFNDKGGIEKFLASKGYRKMPQPRKEDGSKYTAAEFCKEIAKFDKKYILSLAHHDVAVINKKVYDIWDSTEKCVGNYWER